MSNYEDWYPTFEETRWSEVPEQTAIRVRWAVGVLHFSLEQAQGEPILFSFHKIINNDDGSYSRSVTDYYGVATQVNDDDPARPTAVFDWLEEAIIDIDVEELEDGSSKVNSRFEQILGLSRLAIVDLSETVDLTGSPLAGTRFAGRFE